MVRIIGSKSLRVACFAAVAAVAIGCSSSSDATGTGSIALALTPNNATLQPGGSTQVVGTLTRTNFTGTVTITVEGVPSGVAGTVTAPPTSGNTATVTLSATGGAAPGVYTLTVRAAGDGVSDATATFTLTIAPTTGSSFTFTPGSGSLSIAAGSSGGTALTFVRTNFTGTIALTAENLPSGATASFSPASVSGLSSTLTITVAGSVAPGVYNVLIRGTAIGVTDVTAPVALTVTTGAGASFSFTPCPPPASWPTVLVAIQDETAAWTALTPVNGTYSGSFQSTKGGFLQVSVSGSSSEVDVVYGTPAELTQYMGTACVGAGTSYPVTVNNLGAGESAIVGLSGGSTTLTGPGNQSGSVSAYSAAADLLAALSTPAADVAKLILRRNAVAAVLAPIDFTTAEAFAPVAPALTITGTGADAVGLSEEYLSGTPFANRIWTHASSTTLPTAYFGMPMAKQLSGDLHNIFANTLFTTGDPSTSREVTYYFHDPIARTLAFDPLPATGPTITSAGTAPYARLRMQWQAPAGHKYWQLNYYTSTPSLRNVVLTVTAGYLGGNAVDVTFPDLSALAGWNSSWMPGAGGVLTWGFFDNAWSGQQSTFGLPTDGLLTQTNIWHSTITP